VDGRALCSEIQGSHSLDYKKIRGLFQAPRSNFPGPRRKPAMFKYSNKQQLRSLGERCKFCQQGPVRNPGRESIFSIPAAQKTYLMDTIMAIFVCINMSLWNQKLPCTSLPSKFQDFPGPRSFSRISNAGNFPIKIPGFSRRRGNPGDCSASTKYIDHTDKLVMNKLLRVSN